MNCLKCGNETKDNQVFCSHCLNIMERYPVKPDVRVHLPSHTPKASPRKPWYKRRNIRPEDKLQQLKKTVRALAILAVILAISLFATGAALAHMILNQDDPNLGKNYTYESTIE